MATFGKIDHFNSSVEKFDDYEERLRFYFQANDVIDPDKQRAILLTVIGPHSFKLLKDLCQPKKLTELPFDELCQKLKSHFDPPPSKFLSRARFEARRKQRGESVQEYIVALKSLAEHCSFGETLEDRLCEKLVTGLDDINIQRKLLLEKDITFSRACEIVTTVSQTNENSKYLSETSTSSASDIHFTSHRDRKPVQTKCQDCYRCGGQHHSQSCRFKEATCYACNKIGHISKVCRSKLKQPHHFQQKNKSSSSLSQHQPRSKPRQFKNHLLLEDTDPQSVSMLDLCCKHPTEEFDLFTLGPISDTPIHVDLQLDGNNVNFQIDTGAALTVMTKHQYDSMFPYNEGNTMQKTKKLLKTYTGQPVPIFGERMINVNYNNQTHLLPLLIVDGRGPPLLGRNWLKFIKLDWKNLFANISSKRGLPQILDEFEKVGLFKPPGKLKGFTAKIHLKSNANPVFRKARQPPFKMREGIESELRRLENNQIITPTEFSDWATPIVPVLKRDGSIRICGDYKTTINRVTESDNHPIPRIDDLAQKLVGGEKFTKIDFSNAYTQLELDEESKPLTTINTHKGLFQYNRLCFGISSAPGIFQRVMENLFKNVPMTVNYFDDLYVTGRTDNEHLANLETVFTICANKGLALNKNKCEFMQKEITFLGHKLSKEGIRPLAETVRAIIDAPRPESLQQLRSFLGLINHYSKFIPGSSSILAPLYNLLKNNTRFKWSDAQEKAFVKAKNLLSSDKVLTHFDQTKRIMLTCDASPVGVGAVLSHVDENNQEKPIYYASRSLSPAEKKYSQIDRESLSIIFGVKKFHKYIYGQHITIVTDHKPLLGIFGETKSIPEHASARVQRWALTLSAYSYNLIYKPGKDNFADAFSRLPLQTSQPEELSDVPTEVLALFAFLDNSPITSHDIARETQLDPTLREVIKFTRNGWPDKPADSFRSFVVRKNELSVENNCLLWGTRVVIPETLRDKILELLHETHIGVVKMKALARSWVWWRNIDADIERLVKLCYICQSHKNELPKAPLHPWSWPEKPWSRIHIDFAGPFLGHMFLIICDAHSKWLEVKLMNKITASHTILALRDVFSTFGLPDTIVSDNGPTFTSIEFSNFLSHNGVKHITVAPYHPSSNGLAERSVQTFKNAMIKMNGSVRERVFRFLTKYRCTPHSTTGLSPAELMLGRKFKTHLDLLHPSLSQNVYKRQSAQKLNHDVHSRDRDIGVNENVFVRNHCPGKGKWIDGTVTEKTGPVSYRVHTDSGVVRCHVDQVRERVAEKDPVPTATDDNDKNPTSSPLPISPKITVSSEHESSISTRSPTVDYGKSDVVTRTSSSPMPEMSSTPLALRKPKRHIKAPDRLTFD